MNKRITSLWLSVIMVLSMMVTAVPAFAAPTDNGIFASAETVSPGSEFTVTVKFAPTENLVNLSYQVYFDKDIFEVTAYTLPKDSEMDVDPDTGSVSRMFSSVTNANDNGFFSASYMDNDTENKVNMSNGFEATATLKVKDTAALSDYTIEMKNAIMKDVDNNSYFPTELANPITITVAAAPVDATGISLNKETTTITAGQSETLTATVEPSDSTDTVTWESSDTAVATVDNTGKVSAVAKGTATITAKAGDKSATCAVTVTCAHSISDVTAQESTCTVQGWDAHKKCTLCGQLFNTAEEEISVVPLRALKAHNGGTADCSHKAVCTVCSQPYGEYGDHNYGTLVAKVAPKCGVEGMEAHYKCSICNKFFTDAKVETTEAALKIAALAHVPGEWKSDDTNHWKECTTVGCDAIIDKAAHDWDWVIDQVATEDATGLKHEKCSVCGKTRSENTVIDKLDHVHDMTKHEAKAATCCEEGNVAYWTCSSDNCEGTNYANEEGTEILETIKVDKDADNHAGGTEIKNAKEATATEKGYTGDKVCKGCGAVLEQGKEIPATGTTEPEKPADPTEPTKPATPKTGDTGNMMLWIALLFVSGAGVFGATLYSKKKKERA